MGLGTDAPLVSLYMTSDARRQTAVLTKFKAKFKGARLALIHRTAISNERIVAITEREVVLSVRADDAGH